MDVGHVVAIKFTKMVYVYGVMGQWNITMSMETHIQYVNNVLLDPYQIRHIQNVFRVIQVPMALQKVLFAYIVTKNLCYTQMSQELQHVKHARLVRTQLGLDVKNVLKDIEGHQRGVRNVLLATVILKEPLHVNHVQET